MHLLTATKTEALNKLSDSPPIEGKSKCNDVTVEFRASSQFDRRDQMLGAINEALTKEQQKMLVVCNSARMAHQLFEKYKTDAAVTIPIEHRLKFGKVALGKLVEHFKKSGVESRLIDKLGSQFFRDTDVVLDDLPNGTSVKVSLQEIVAKTTEIMERQCWQVKHALSECNRHNGESMEVFLTYPMPRQIAGVLQEQLEGATEPSETTSRG